MEKSRYCDICKETNCTKNGGVPDMGYLKPDCYIGEKDVPDNLEKKCEKEKKK